MINCKYTVRDWVHVVLNICSKLLIEILLILATYMLFTWVKNNDYQYKEPYVSGVVISSNTEQYAHGKHHRNMSTRYIMAIRPDDMEKYKPFSLYVDYVTYVTYKPGNRIAFNDLNKIDVCRNVKHRSLLNILFTGFLPTILFTVFGLVAFIYPMYLLGKFIDEYIDI